MNREPDPTRDREPNQDLQQLGKWGQKPQSRYTKFLAGCFHSDGEAWRRAEAQGLRHHLVFNRAPEGGYMALQLVFR